MSLDLHRHWKEKTVDILEMSKNLESWSQEGLGTSSGHVLQQA